MNKKTMIAMLKKHQKAIAEERDKLRELLEEFNNLEESATEAERALQDAIDALSQYV